MKRYNIILLTDQAGENVLMCRRKKPPYQGLMNLVGGKVEPGEAGLHAAYRELREETGVTARDVALIHLITFSYPGGGAGLPAYELEAYVGRLRREVCVSGSENPLCWMSMREDFFDMSRFAGEGSIGHVVQTAIRYRPDTLAEHAATMELAPISESDLTVLAYYSGCQTEDMRPLLRESTAKVHDGRYYERFVVRANGCTVGTASLYEHVDGTISDGIEIFPPFRRCGYAAWALRKLVGVAENLGYRVMRAQVRTENAASLALHERVGFHRTRVYMNRRGNEVYDLQLQIKPGCRHEMNLRPRPFAAIASGEKRYELRLLDEKRRLIRVGDELLFSCTTDERTVLTRITGLHTFPNFAALYAALPLTECGYTKENVRQADPRDMEAYYPPEKQEKYGVLAIELERVRCPLQMLNGRYHVRELHPSDVPEILRVAEGNPLYYEYMGIQPTQENIAETFTALPPRKTLADKHFFGWFDGERLVAVMDLIMRHPQERMAFIGWFMVDASRQGCDLGRELVAGVLRMLSTAGVAEVRLGRIEGNQQSERFWQVCGFQNTELGYDADSYHVIVMKKCIE